MIWGGDGNDTLNAGENRLSRLHGGPGNDSVNGGSRRDFLWGGFGVDTEKGGAGNDVLHALAPDNQARFQVPTLRNVDKRPYPAFVKAYGHNGYFKSLKSIVHFYNTRDVLPSCELNDPGEGMTCWPAPESIANMNTKRVGRLGLSAAEEDALVSFMQTLSDGYMTLDPR